MHVGMNENKQSRPFWLSTEWLFRFKYNTCWIYCTSTVVFTLAFLAPFIFSAHNLFLFILKTSPYPPFHLCFEVSTLHSYPYLFCLLCFLLIHSSIFPSSPTTLSARPVCVCLHGSKSSVSISCAWRRKGERKCPDECVYDRKYLSAWEWRGH